MTKSLSRKEKIDNSKAGINDQELRDTISDIPAKTMPQRLARNLSSEMSIECSTTANHEQDYDLMLDEIESSEELSLIEQKVKTVFELPDSETLVNEFPCYLIRLVTLPGWMYITNRHICFYASLPGKKKGPYKAGYLSKKNHITSPRTYRYYFELRNHVLSWYASAETKYSPLNSIDLKCITKIEPSKLKKLGIRLTTNKHHHYTIIADSELSQREWMDELQKGVFVAQHAGNSVRIVLPFSKITSVDKPSVFQFAANIKIKFQEDANEPSSEDYYFAFFPDIEVAYHEIIATWKSIPDDQKALMIRNNKNALEAIKSASNSTSFLSFDSFLDNVSPAALPTMLMGKLMNLTSLFQQGSTNPEQRSGTSDDEQSQDTEEQQDAQLTASPNEMTATSLASKFKRNSLFFNKSANSTDTSNEEAESSVAETPPSQDYLNDTQQQTENENSSRKMRPLSGSYSLTKIPRVVTDAIKHQMLRADNTSTVSGTSSSDTEQLQLSTNDTRSRSSSLSALRHHISPFHRHTKMSGHNQQNVTDSLPHLTTANTPIRHNQGDISIISHQDTDFTLARNDDSIVSPRKHRAKSVGSMLLPGTWHKLVPSGGDDYYQQQHLNESQHRHPKAPAWLSNKLIDILDAAGSAGSMANIDDEEYSQQDDESTTSRKFTMDLHIHKDLENPQLKEEEQQTMNDHLNANFPMLLKTEQVEAALKASFWRTIPYSGKIYITERYFCFHSKILAGQQKLVLPWQDVIQVNMSKSKSYYLAHALTMIVKDMADELYFDFSSIELRDLCYYICQLKCEKFENKATFDGSSIYSRDSDAGVSISSNIILDRPEHVPPPVGYDGPPLLSSSSSLSKPTKKYMSSNKSLHFTCLTIGSRGDVQPYIALCKELQKDGHRCRIATHPEYQDWITGHDIEFRSVGGDPGELMKLCIDNSFLSVSFIREGAKFFYTWFDSLLESSYEACQGTDVIIESPSAMVGIHMAEKLEIPYFRSMPFPFSRTTKFPHPFAMQSSAGGRIYNDMTYVMIDMALWAGTSKYVNRFRRDRLQLPPTNLDRMELWKVPYIYSFSPTVVHPPKDWPDYIHCTGYWFLDNPDMKWKPETALELFLEDKQDKRPIVYIGFGSIIVPDAVETTRIIVDAVLKADVRAIICKGWSARTLTSSKVNHKKSRSDGDVGQIKQAEDAHEEDSEALLDQHPGTIYHIESVPHDWLFPRIQGVVHHGGAGTTAAGLRAGLPTVIKPFFGDQRFWGQRIEQLQVGICLNKLNRSHLADALKTITQNTALIAKAQKVGETIRKENGPRNAVESIYREFEFAKEQRMFRSA